jgi:uncharacterized protein (DUF885 family)
LNILLISLFTVWKKNEKNYFFIEKEMFQSTKEYLEKIATAFNMTYEDLMSNRHEISHLPPYLQDFVTNPKYINDIEMAFAQAMIRERNASSTRQ